MHYFCLLPDMYYRIGTLRFDFVRRAEGMRPTMFAAMNSLTNALVTEDTAAWLGFLDAQDKVRPGGIGCIGYCMSGRYVTTVAARFPNRFAASASLYGVGIVTNAEDSPHLLIDRIKGEMYFGFAETDEHVPANVIPTLKSGLLLLATPPADCLRGLLVGRSLVEFALRYCQVLIELAKPRQIAGGQLHPRWGMTAGPEEEIALLMRR